MSIRFIQILFNRSAKIQHAIELEKRRKFPDRWRLMKLKKLRLHIQDRIQRLVWQGGQAQRQKPAYAMVRR